VGGVGVGRTLETPIGENKDKRATKSREKKKGPEKNCTSIWGKQNEKIESRILFEHILNRYRKRGERGRRFMTEKSKEFDRDWDRK